VSGATWVHTTDRQTLVAKHYEHGASVSGWQQQQQQPCLTCTNGAARSASERPSASSASLKPPTPLYAGGAR
jgi:hypothetical protein